MRFEQQSSQPLKESLFLFAIFIKGEEYERILGASSNY